MTRSRFVALALVAVAGLFSGCCSKCIKDPPCKPCEHPTCCNQPNPCASPCAAPCGAPCAPPTR